MNIAHLTALRTLLSQSSNFRAWVSALNAADALDSIILGKAAPDSDVTRYALLGVAQPSTWQRTAHGAGIGAGKLTRSARLTFVRLLEDGDALGETLASAFMTNVGLFMVDIVNQAGATSAAEDSYYAGWTESLDDHLLPHDLENPGIYPRRTRKGDTQGYLFTADWELTT